MSVCTVRCCACGAGPVPGGCWDSGSGQPLAACTSLTLWSSAVRAAVVLHLGVWKVRGLTHWESVVREGRDSVQCCVCEWLQTRHCVLPVISYSVIICVSGIPLSLRYAVCVCVCV